MARRMFTVVDVVELLRHWYAGDNVSQMARALGLDRKTVRKYTGRAEAAGILGTTRYWTPELHWSAFQLPPYIVCKDSSFDYLTWAKEQFRDATVLVEFRHASWLEEANRARTLSFLKEKGMALVIVDAPQLESNTVIPTVVALTSDVAYVRFHGRNAATWHNRGGSAADRFDYLYTREELAEWVEPLRELSGSARQLFAVFNNNNSSPPPGPLQRPLAQAPANALMLRQLLLEAEVPVASGLADAALEKSEQYRIEGIGSLEAD